MLPIALSGPYAWITAYNNNNLYSVQSNRINPSRSVIIFFGWCTRLPVLSTTVESLGVELSRTHYAKTPGAHPCIGNLMTFYFNSTSYRYSSRDLRHYSVAVWYTLPTMPSGGDVALEDGPGYVLAAAGTVNEGGDEEEDVVARSSNGSADKNEEGCEEGEYLESVSPTTTTIINDGATLTADEKCLNAEGASVYSLAIPANPTNISGSPTTPGNTASITGAAEAMADSVVATELLRDSAKVRNHFTSPPHSSSSFFSFLSFPSSRSLHYYLELYAPIPFGHIEAALRSVSLTSFSRSVFFFYFFPTIVCTIQIRYTFGWHTSTQRLRPQRFQRSGTVGLSRRSC